MSSSKRPRSDSYNGYIVVDNALKRPSTKRAKEIDANTPYDDLVATLRKNKSEGKTRNVLHWFRSKDIRQEDNKALHAAAEKAKKGGNLITMYLHSPEDLEWHGTSPARSDFIFECLKILQAQLEKKHIPLAIVTCENRKHKTKAVQEFIKKHDISHVFSNMEYEVDELRRDVDLAKKAQAEGISFEVLHDQCAVPPVTLKTGSGGPHKVFTPYHKVWLAEMRKKDTPFLRVVPPPEGNEKGKEDLSALFGSKLPTLPEGKQFVSDAERDRIRALWPAGHDAGMKRLSKFLDDKVSNYAARRSEPAGDPTSRLSPYFSAGIISVREALQVAQAWNKGKHFDAGDEGVASWVREIVFREFYRQQTVITPHVSMNLPVNLKFDNVQWREDKEGWEKWCEGRTGVPWVDAGMRQLNTEAYMHNRLRMTTASYLRANLLIDYRKGERYFAEHLIDWDMSNNTQGWDPSYTVFNPTLQAEKCDKQGDYIRKWVPELKDVKGKAVFAPFERLSEKEFKKLSYPEPHCDYSETSARAKARYKEDLANAP